MNKNNIKNRLLGLDFLKYICAFMVICIHKKFPGVVGAYFTPLTRIAVPIFFMITGYFYTSTLKRGKEKNQIFKVLKLLVVSNVLYFVWDMLIQLKNGTVVSWLHNRCSFKVLINFLLFNESPFCSALWYLGALLYVLIIIYLTKQHRNKLYPLIPLLLFINITLGNYSLPIFGRTFSLTLTRNFLFVGMPYFLIGDYIYTRKLKLKNRVLIIGSAFFAITTVIEQFLLGMFDLIGKQDHYISTAFSAIFIFMLVIQNEKIFTQSPYSTVASWGLRFSMHIYIIHPMVITVLSEIVNLFGAHIQILPSVYDWIAPFIILFISTVLSFVIELIMKHIKAKKQ